MKASPFSRPHKAAIFSPWGADQSLIWEMSVEFIDDSLVACFPNFVYA
jgi:hypothetical protein